MQNIFIGDSWRETYKKNREARYNRLNFYQKIQLKRSEYLGTYLWAMVIIVASMVLLSRSKYVLLAFPGLFFGLWLTAGTRGQLTKLCHEFYGHKIYRQMELNGLEIKKFSQRALLFFDFLFTNDLLQLEQNYNL